MATTRQLRRVFQAIAAQDWQSAKLAASSIAEAESLRGNTGAARSLNDALSSSRPSSAALVSEQGIGLMTGHRSELLKDLVLNPALRSELCELIEEWKHKVALHESGVPLRRKLLLTGPPGCGKSITAQALANELGVPFYVVRFDSLIGAYLGQTAVNLRRIFRFAEAAPSVILFDEIDAIGQRRGSFRDIGELDRIVIALMQELELSEPKGLIVTTSNISQSLDQALLRRFDIILKFPKPSPENIRLLAIRVAEGFGQTVNPSLLRRLNTAKSYADAEKLTIAFFRKKLLAELRTQNAQ